MDVRKYRSNNDYVSVSYCSRVSYGELGSCPIDQIDCKDFNIDPVSGQPMSDLDRLIHAQSDSEMLALFSQLSDSPSSFGLPEKCTPEQVQDALAYMSPRLAQLPSELAHQSRKFIEYRVQRQRSLLLQRERAAAAAERQRMIDEFNNKSNENSN